MMSDHPGMSTFHAESPELAVERIALLLEADTAMNSHSARKMFASAVDWLLQIGFDADGRRRVFELVEVGEKLDEKGEGEWKCSKQNAANYGARMGSVAQNCRSCAAYAAATEAIRRTAVHHAGVQILAPGGVVGSVLRIRVTGDAPNMMGPLLSLIGGPTFAGPIPVSAEATFRAEGW